MFLSLLVRALAGSRSTVGTDELDRLGCRVVYDMDSSLPEQLVGKYAALRFVDGVLRRFERFAIANSDLVLATLDLRLQAQNDFDVDAVVEFLGSLTAEDAFSLSEVVPASVPSGLPIF